MAVLANPDDIWNTNLVEESLCNSLFLLATVSCIMMHNAVERLSLLVSSSKYTQLIVIIVTASIKRYVVSFLESASL